MPSERLKDRMARFNADEESKLDNNNNRSKSANRNHSNCTTNHTGNHKNSSAKYFSYRQNMRKNTSQHTALSGMYSGPEQVQPTRCTSKLSTHCPFRFDDRIENESNSSRSSCGKNAEIHNNIKDGGLSCTLLYDDGRRIVSSRPEKISAVTKISEEHSLDNIIREETVDDVQGHVATFNCDINNNDINRQTTDHNLNNQMKDSNIFLKNFKNHQESVRSYQQVSLLKLRQSAHSQQTFNKTKNNFFKPKQNFTETTDNHVDDNVTNNDIKNTGYKPKHAPAKNYYFPQSRPETKQINSVNKFYSKSSLGKQSRFNFDVRDSIKNKNNNNFNDRNNNVYINNNNNNNYTRFGARTKTMTEKKLSEELIVKYLDLNSHEENRDELILVWLSEVGMLAEAPPSCHSIIEHSSSNASYHVIHQDDDDEVGEDGDGEKKYAAVSQNKVNDDSKLSDSKADNKHVGPEACVLEDW
ncbi:hypothetical protein HELRODRAFT_165996 [Helobdella robusta]|uniref:Uncharacterized protein n=1 Tax=Helobdella robusta TaxID=6412 RepID=T1EXJ9_HELRO|nr:hypothetical protein HELRODRAFT_165996 [Helobdella robusta]ESN90337.1 hypothetical protein HELRODRAFT_165996 [Helobdella robusta]